MPVQASSKRAERLAWPDAALHGLMVLYMELPMIRCCVYVPFNIRALHGALQHALHGGWPYGFLAR
uniref:Uncharacterized protein n=1 Tax=Meloidogyne enterolobii TaxID=390850 RepID=A0A6V7TM44_MELEN|nr:unnamed protein product [Meloidogyne enterolobii]